MIVWAIYQVSDKKIIVPPTLNIRVWSYYSYTKKKKMNEWTIRPTEHLQFHMAGQVIFTNSNCFSGYLKLQWISVVAFFSLEYFIAFKNKFKRKYLEKKVFVCFRADWRLKILNFLRFFQFFQVFLCINYVSNIY